MIITLLISLAEQATDTMDAKGTSVTLTYYRRRNKDEGILQRSKKHTTFVPAL